MVHEEVRPCSEQKRGVLLPICVICEETPLDGIAGGILVSGRFLCARCEEEIVRMQVGDSRYSRYKDKIKKIWGRVIP